MNLSHYTKLEENVVFIPYIFNREYDAENQLFEEFLRINTHIKVVDEIQSQLEELIKLRYPKKKFSEKELHEKTTQHLGKNTKDKYGVWVYYPWMNKIVHLLDKDEFVEVRTNRNHYKITPEEEKILENKKIGVIGLSVGNAIATTIATERICGELVLADFDEIELSNLNRIQTGVQNFGLKKTVVAARHIAEIDPFLKITCYHEGLTEENMDDFFTKDGKLDICIEVCDGLSTKIFARKKAKELGIPVVMNSSDRGTTDIERYDTEPDRPILHGLIDHLDMDLVKHAKTNEEKVPYLLPMLGVDTSSERLKASMIEIEETITTWPQLASGVIFGGGICTDVCRRILLGHFNASGRYFVDTEEHINDDVQDYITISRQKNDEVGKLPVTTIKDYEKVLHEANNRLFKQNNNEHVELKSEEIAELVKYGITAPSGGNVQPWKWLYKYKKLMLFNDINRSASILNYKNTASYIALGAAAENVVLKAHKMGYEVQVEKFPLEVDNNLVAAFSFYSNTNEETESHADDHLVDYVLDRVTNRNLGKRITMADTDINYLLNSAQSIQGANITVFSDVEKMEALKNILAEVDKIFMTNKTGHFHFINEIRWNQKEVVETCDGIDIETIDLTPAEKAGLIVSKNWNVTKHIKKWKLGNEFGKISRKAVDAASALGIITMPSFTSENYFDGGRAVQKVWLAATERGLAFQPMSVSTFLFAKVGDGNFDQIEEAKENLSELYNQLREICGLSEDEKDVFFFRLAKVEEPLIKALRRPVKDVLMYE